MRLYMKQGVLSSFLAKRMLMLAGQLVRVGTEPRAGNPIYALNF
jgi:hypothetical protein